MTSIDRTGITRVLRRWDPALPRSRRGRTAAGVGRVAGHYAPAASRWSGGCIGHRAGAPLRIPRPYVFATVV
jgi:hypothetical protein